jgi:predicted nucleic acid-binding protein
MPDSRFVDTNILLYAAIKDGSTKHHAARDLITGELPGSELVISAQVLGEFFVNALRKGADRKTVEDTVRQFIADFVLVPVTGDLVGEAMRISGQYGFSYWDSLIVAAALDAGCTVLYTEDLQNGQTIDGSLKIINPFPP